MAKRIEGNRIEAGGLAAPTRDALERAVTGLIEIDAAGNVYRGASMIKPIWPSLEDLNEARSTFEENEPRDLFYRIATELVTLSIEGKTSISLPEALASLLQTWNITYYRFKKFDSQHFQAIDRLIKETLSAVLKIRTDKASRNPEIIKALFILYEDILGPVGASKCLHLLAPNVFPLWDREIAKGYGVPIRLRGDNADRYFQFYLHAQEQSRRLGVTEIAGKTLLKAIDEYNYCRFTLGLPKG